MFEKKIRMDDDLYQRAKKFSTAQGYSSLEEFVSHLIEKELQRAEETDTVEEIEKKMKGLGYFS